MTFEPLFVPDAFRDAVADEAWVQAMLDAERALARAEARAGLVPEAAADAIADGCRAELYDAGRIAAEGRAVGNPAEPLVRALRDRLSDDAAGYVHFGATSQDVVDTAAMLVARAARALLLDELRACAAACAALAEGHRSTPMAARTLLQQAVPTTFGLKAAAWLVALLDARRGLADVRLPAQLGGAAGTLAALGAAGPEVARQFAAELELDELPLPWHANRAPVAALAAALQAAAAACATVGLDVVLLAQNEVGEVAEAAGGASSTMPHKRNPVRAVLARACARLVHANAAVLTSGEHEHERSAGAWQAEWPALSTALAFAGGAAAATRECLEGLEVDPQAMRRNMSGALYSERDGFVERGLIEPDDAYLGSAETFVDRALARHREELG
jgi:3-carboxy-cis,cis-muconate cycloisomerase